MKKMFFVISFFSAILFNSVILAQQFGLDLKGLSEEQKAQLVIQAEQMKKQSQNPLSGISSSNLSPEKLNQWVELGKNVGLALTAVAKELGVASDEFLKSNTGKVTLVLIVWKVMGKDILGVIGGTLAWVILTGIIIWSFSFFHMKKKVKDSNGKIEYISRYQFESSDAKNTSASIHVILFCAATIVCMIIVFG